MPSNPTSQFTLLDGIAILARWGLGGWFVYMGLEKALQPESFLKLVHQYDLVHDWFLLNCIAAALPWFEVFCGGLLLAGVAVRGAGLMMASMLIPFTAAVLQRALAIASAQGLALCAVKFDCGCGHGEVFICRKVLENTLLLLLALFVLRGDGRQLSLRFSLRRTGRAETLAPGASHEARLEGS